MHRHQRQQSSPSSGRNIVSQECTCQECLKNDESSPFVMRAVCTGTNGSTTILQFA